MALLDRRVRAETGAVQFSFTCGVAAYHLVLTSVALRRRSQGLVWHMYASI